MFVNRRPFSRPLAFHCTLLVLSAASLLALSACGGSKEKGGATQVAAKVNSDEITVHQIDFVLRQQRNLRPEQVDAASKQVLERLIDEQIAVQKAVDSKLDRDPQTVQAIEAARREILARRYIESLADKSARPADNAVQQYYSEHPGLFSNRKIYTLQKTDVLVPAAQRAEVVAHAQSTESPTQLADWLKAQNLRFNSNASTVAAEALPLQIVDKIATLSDGQSVVVPQEQGVSVLTVVSTQPAMKTLEEARPAIQQFLLVQAQRSAVADIQKHLRDGAKIEYEGNFKATAAAGVASDVAGRATPAPAAASAAVVPATPASGIDSATLHKGLGLK